MNQTNERLNDVPARFEQIPQKVRESPFFGSTKKYLGARNDGIVQWPDYTSNIENELGLGEHIQGIQRIGRHLIVSGGIKTGIRRSQLILIEMGTRPTNGPWALPEYGHYKDPPPADKIAKVVDIDFDKWHAGGIQAMGEVLAVPIYNGQPGSEIRYFDLSDLGNGPIEIVNIRLRKDDMRAKAAALTRLPNDSLVTMLWDDEDLDFHFSLSADIRNGFQMNHTRVHKTEVEGGFQPGGGEIISGMGTYQNLNLVVDTDGNVYFVSTRNSQKASPTLPGRDLADLYRISWPNGHHAPPHIVFQTQKHMFCYNQQCNFGAGAGIYVDDQSHLFLYGAAHWLHGKNSRYNFNEYSYI